LDQPARLRRLEITGHAFVSMLSARLRRIDGMVLHLDEAFAGGGGHAVEVASTDTMPS